MYKFSILIALVLGSLQLAAQSQTEQAIQALVIELEKLHPEEKNIAVMPVRASLNGMESLLLESYALMRVEQELKKSKVFKPITTHAIDKELSKERWLLPESYAAYNRINKLNFAYGGDLTSAFLLMSFKDQHEEVILEGMYIPDGIVSDGKTIKISFNKDTDWYKLIGKEAPVALLDQEIIEEESLELLNSQEILAITEGIEIDFYALPQTRIIENLEVTLLSAELNADKLIYDFVLVHKKSSKKLPAVNARMIDAKGLEFMASTNELSNKELISNTSTKAQIVFDAVAGLSGSAQVLELDFIEWNMTMNFRNIEFGSSTQYSALTK